MNEYNNAMYILKNMTFNKKYAIVTFMYITELNKTIEKILQDDDILYDLKIELAPNTFAYQTKIVITNELDMITAKMKYI